MLFLARTCGRARGPGPRRRSVSGSIRGPRVATGGARTRSARPRSDGRRHRAAAGDRPVGGRGPARSMTGRAVLRAGQRVLPVAVSRSRGRTTATPCSPYSRSPVPRRPTGSIRRCLGRIRILGAGFAVVGERPGHQLARIHIAGRHRKARSRRARPRSQAVASPDVTVRPNDAPIDRAGLVAAGPAAAGPERGSPRWGPRSGAGSAP
jgi:hypothetical protein